MLKKSNNQIYLTVFLLIFSVAATAFFYYEIFLILSSSPSNSIWLFIIISTFILYGNIIYHLTRLGYYIRLSRHEEVTKEELNSFLLDENIPTVTYLIPSYKEETKVIEQTIWSAALQNYARQKIVLLIDNPPNPENEADKKLLVETREITVKVQGEFDAMKQLADKNYKKFINNFDAGEINTDIEMNRLADLYDSYRKWLIKNLWEYQVDSHVDKFFLRKTYMKWFEEFSNESQHWRSNKNQEGDVKLKIKGHYNRLINILDVEFSSFERKKYKNLNHEPNKAMNVNSYLDLIGKNFRIFNLDDDKYLETTKDPDAPLSIADSKYVITLDADSILLPDYTLKLVFEMEKEDNRKVAVIQTPYSSFPGATSPVEIIAGATTDIQYNIHQGFTYYNSTYWVGANAMIRKTALDDLKIYEVDGDHVTTKYIQDRTVIEDTESSIDLVQKGWTLYNYPERLAYSATPPDFGSLIIQRERWANGGLIIFPKLVKYILKKPYSPKRWVEFFIRMNYLTSIAGVNIGTLLLLLYPFGDVIFSWWLPLGSIPYFFLYTYDLKKIRYKLSDMVRVYALNLVLIPINIAGVIKSIEQGLTGRKIPFKRTPKIGDRVAVGTKFILFQYLLLLYILIALFFDISQGHWTHATYSFINGSILLYAIITFIGVYESFDDVKAQVFAS